MIYRFFLSLIIAFSILTPAFPQSRFARTLTTTPGSDLQKNLQTIEARIENRRQQLGIPGMSLVIVKDGEIVFIKGFGYKDLEKKVPVTPDTQFAIGSITKSFTSLGVLMSADEGKLSLDDSPKKYLSYFKMKNPETDEKITVRDLMDHSSGLNRTDLAMLTGKLSRQELIRMAGEAEPLAKLNERFLYNNVMYSAAGEILGSVQKTSWENFVQNRIFAPLGMNNSTVSIARMQKAKDYSFGYQYNSDTGKTTKFPIELAFRPIDSVAAAGAITSSARDMAKWISFVINKGEINGAKLISEKSFEEWTKPQNKITPDGKTAYSLGWFLRELDGRQGIGHGGNVPGFTSWAAMIPEEKLGFVILANVSNSPFGNEFTSIIFDNLLEKKAATETETADPVSPEKETGTYRFEQAGINVEVQIKDGKLIALIPGQPVYNLENIGGRKYKIANAPAGFFVTFKDDSLLLEQPQGKFTLAKSPVSGENPDQETNKIPKITEAEIMAKAIEAIGGEANHRKITSRVTLADTDLIHQGVKGTSTVYAKFPNKSATETTFTAVGKSIGTGWNFFDGKNGEESYTFLPAEKYAGKRIEDVRLDSDFYGILNWQTNYQKVEVKEIEKVGNEDCYVVEFTPEKGTKVKDFYSTKTFYLMKRQGEIVSGTGPNEPYILTFFDYREIDGIKLPFRTVQTTGAMGDIISTVKKVEHNVKIEDKIFRSRNFVVR